MALLNTTIILRNDSTANWLANENVILARGEVAIEFLANGKVKMKIGDGEKTWAQLSYFGGESAKYYDVVPEVDEDGSVEIHLDAITRVVNGATLSSGDIAVVKETFAPGKTQYTAYVYDGDAATWKAMDGNYSADNVYTAKDLTLAGNFTTIGNYEKGDVIAAGTSLQDVLSGMLQQELYPTANDKPSASISVSSGSGEVGSSYTLPEVTLTVKDVGSYTYGPATGIVFQAGNLTLSQDGTTNRVSNTSDYGAAKTLKLTATDSATLYTDSAKSYKFVASGTYTQGAMPVTNLNNEYPTVRIASGTATAVNKDNGGQAYRTITRSGWRNYWYGFISTTEYSNITRNTSTNAVGDGTKTLIAGGSAISNKTLPTITAAAGDRMPVVVMPTSARKKVASASMPSSLNAPVTFTKLGTVNLEGYNGASAVSYDVWGYVADDMPVGADFSIVIANA